VAGEYLAVLGFFVWEVWWRNPPISVYQAEASDY